METVGNNITLLEDEGRRQLPQEEGTWPELRVSAFLFCPEVLGEDDFFDLGRGRFEAEDAVWPLEEVV